MSLGGIASAFGEASLEGVMFIKVRVVRVESRSGVIKLRIGRRHVDSCPGTGCGRHVEGSSWYHGRKSATWVTSFQRAIA